MWKLWVLLAILGVAAVLAGRLRPAAARPRFFRQAGLVLAAGLGLIGGGWFGAEVFADPGGWRATGLVAGVLVPVAGLLLVAWYRPAWATVLCSVLTAALVGLSMWFSVDPDGWRAFENDAGPVRAIATLALAAPVALLGWRRPLPAGVLLVVLGVVPVVLSAAGTLRGLGSLTAVSLPLVLIGALFLLAEAVRGRAPANPPVGGRPASGG
jgi:hypothetical protein